MNDRIHFTSVGEKFVTQAFSLARALDQSGYVDHLDGGGDDGGGSGRLGQGGKAGVRNLNDSGVRVDRAKGVIGRLRLARLGKGIEQGAFAYVGKAYYSCLEHDVLSEKKRKMNQEDEMVKDARPRRRAFLVDAIPLFFNLCYLCGDSSSVG